MYGAVALDIFTRTAEQRTHDLPVSLFHTAQTSDTGTTHKVEHKCLDIVVGMMRHCHTWQIVLLKELVKPSVSQLSSRHFYRLLCLRRISGRIEMFHYALDTQTPAQRPHKRLVPVTLRPTQMKVAMRRHTAHALLHQHVKQCDAVGTSTQRDQHLLMCNIKLHIQKLSLSF
jgi:hypothetical protein